MDLDIYPLIIQEYILELLKRKTISPNSLIDKTLLNYLYLEKIDRDYLKGLRN